jgi:D-alanine-D-alanine ligase
MHRIRVGVIRGGPSNEYEVSLKTGATVLNHLPQDKYNPREIFIDRNSNWFVNGVPLTPHEALTHVDVVFNALHGMYGEDGKLQHILESHGIPFTGSTSFSSALGMNKKLSKEVYKKSKIKTPQYRIIESKDNLNQQLYEIFRAFPLPLVVKPASGGSSIGISLVKDFNSFENSVNQAFAHSDIVIVEEYIKGKEATCGVIESFRKSPFYTLPPIEIRPHEGTFFDYEAKYEGKSDEIVPGNFTDEEKREIEKLAIEAHKNLGLRHYSRSDFIIHPHRGIFILETDTLPNITEKSLLSKALDFVGAPLSHFLDHVVQLALSRK